MSWVAVLDSCSTMMVTGMQWYDDWAAPRSGVCKGVSWTLLLAAVLQCQGWFGKQGTCCLPVVGRLYESEEKVE